MRPLRLPAALALIAAASLAGPAAAETPSALWAAHADDPVQWRAWSSETLQAAVDSDKPLFFFSAHFGNSLARAMRAETFQNQTIATTLNDSAIPVLVDANEQPELASLLARLAAEHFQAAEWPTCLWTDARLAPLAGGGYFPPTDDWGGQGFLSLARNVAEQWTSRRDEYLAQAQSRLATSRAAAAPPASVLESPADLIDLDPFEPTETPSLPAVELYAYATALPRLPEAQAQAISDGMDAFLQRLFDGAGFDPVSGGFFAGSNDSDWRLPLFQKSTADQALLLSALASLHARDAKPAYRDAIRLTIRFVETDLLKDNGLARQYLSSFAPGESMMDVEGSYYLFGPAELEKASDAARALWGLKAGGNLGPETDILGVYEGQNVPYVATDETLAPSSDRAREELKALRSKKTFPQTDATGYTATNALLARSLAQVARALEDAAALELAESLYNSLSAHCVDQATHGLFNSDSRATPASSLAYAYLISAALELEKATGNEKYFAAARRWQEAWDANSRFLSQNPLLLALPVPDTTAAHYQDLALPSAASVALENLHTLSKQLDSIDLAKRIQAIAADAPATVAEAPGSYRSLLLSLSLSDETP